MADSGFDARHAAFLDAAQGIHDELIGFRRHLRRNPELSWNEAGTSAFIREELSRHGLETSGGFATHGFCADFGADGRPAVAWRADMDALPVEDRITTEYASTVPGLCHACGHDVHSTVAYGIARVLGLRPAWVERPVRIFWQPAEETLPSGAPAMVRDGILDGVAAVMAVHCDPTRRVGTYGIRPGAETASVDTFVITVEAEATAHSARPYTGKDTIWIMNQILSYLYSFGERTTDVRRPSVLSVCQINGGHAHNVIPKTVSCSGTIRTTDPGSRAFYREAIERYLGHLSQIHGVEARLQMITGAPAVVNDAAMAAHALEVLNQTLGSTALDLGEPSLGAEDFAYYQQHVPGLFMRVGTCSGPDTAHPLHSMYFDVDEAAVVPAVALMATLLTTYTP